MQQVIRTTHDKRAKLEVSPHYTDARFKKAQTVFGDVDDGYGHKDLSYVYSDRLAQWDNKKYRAAFEKAKESDCPPQSCSYYEVMLSHYYDKEIKIKHIVSGVNFGNGYPYNVFGYEYEEAPNPSK